MKPNVSSNFISFPYKFSNLFAKRVQDVLLFLLSTQLKATMGMEQSGSATAHPLLNYLHRGRASVRVTAK